MKKLQKEIAAILLSREDYNSALEELCAEIAMPVINYHRQQNSEAPQLTACEDFAAAFIKAIHNADAENKSKVYILEALKDYCSEMLADL